MSDLADRCRGRWLEIFHALGFGFSEKLLKHRNVPCPMCGGTDRFQLNRGREDVGLWYCRVCQEGGDGIKLVMRMLGVDFREAAKRIEQVIGGNYKADPMLRITIPRVVDFPRAETTDTDPLRLWREAVPPIRSTAVERYQATRGHILTASEAAVLRLLLHARHWPTRTRWPAQVALVALHDGTELCAHLTFLAKDGRGKAPVEKPKLFPKGAHPVGGGVWFGRAEPGRELIVAEGIETTLSAMRLCGAVSGCAALSAVGISKLILPPGAQRVRVYADNDAAGQGVRAACEARQRWQGEGRTVAIIHAREVGVDANDIWQRRACR
jgi:putative DNA primase/helicase